MQHETQNDRVCLEIPPKPQFVSLCRLALTAICREHKFSDDEIADLKLAITEACSNSIRHAYTDTAAAANGDATGRDAEKVYITYRMLADRITIEVRDHGRGFDWAGPNDHELPEGGLGISIIEAMSDEFEVLRPADGVGAQLVITKMRRAS